MSILTNRASTTSSPCTTTWTNPTRPRKTKSNRPCVRPTCGAPALQGLIQTRPKKTKSNLPCVRPTRGAPALHGLIHKPLPDGISRSRRVGEWKLGPCGGDWAPHPRFFVNADSKEDRGSREESGHGASLRIGGAVAGSVGGRGAWGLQRPDGVGVDAGHRVHRTKPERMGQPARNYNLIGSAAFRLVEVYERARSA